MPDTNNEPVLHVYKNRSVLFGTNGNQTQFDEGKASEGAIARLAAVRKALEEDFLVKIIVKSQKPDITINGLTEAQTKSIENLISSVTSEVGRAILGLTILQLTIKAISPEQSIRLHKSSKAAHFSWVEGIPMRVLDQNFITPALREYNLLKLNKYGFMMTRSLAENYPYTHLYKAAIKGAKKEWIEIVDWIENEEMNPEQALLQLMIFLHNRSLDFLEKVRKTSKTLITFLKSQPSFDDVLNIIMIFIRDSTYSARIFEIAIHSLFQVFEEKKCLEGYLKPISQMRSANKKHGNIGDIEIVATKDGLDVIEAWDAKYGKTYLRDELEEINEKLTIHPQCHTAGFITDSKPNLKDEITGRLEELSTLHNLNLSIQSFSNWATNQIHRFSLNKKEVAGKWLLAITESICQKRRHVAPIDEPTGEWVAFLHEVINENIT